MQNYCEEEFNKKALDFYNISELIGDDWILNEKESKMYLTKKRKLNIKRKCCKDQEDEEDILTIEYHVLFHNSYQIPALYFNAYLSNGQLVSMEDISKIFVEKFEFKSCHDSMLSIITQSEHPILFKPYFLLHPCKTSQVLSKFPESKNFVLTFLSIFGPSVQLNMSTEYDKFYSKS